jgi:hypothetical protein
MDSSDDDGSRYVWNVGLLQQDYTVLYLRKLSSPDLNLQQRGFHQEDVSCTEQGPVITLLGAFCRDGLRIEDNCNRSILDMQSRTVKKMWGGVLPTRHSKILECYEKSHRASNVEFPGQGRVVGP